MQYRFRFINVIAFVLIFTCLFSMTAFAAAPEDNLEVDRVQALAEIKNQLVNYSRTEVNSVGEEFTVRYSFSSENLDRAAEFILENGFEAFNQYVEAFVMQQVNAEQAAQGDVSLMATDPINPETVRKYISGSGVHSVSGVSYGLASFGMYGTVEYTVQLSYKVTVSGGKVTSIFNPVLSFPSMSPYGSWKKNSIPTYTTDYTAGATANYTVYKTIGDPDEFAVTTEGDFQYFAVFTTLQ